MEDGLPRPGARDGGCAVDTDADADAGGRGAGRGATLRPPRVAILAFEGMSPFHLSVPTLVWGAETPAGDLPPWRSTVVAERPGRLETNAGYAIDVPAGLDALERADLVVVPWWPDPHRAAGDAVTEALRAAHARGAIVVGLCLGVFVVADAGLLDGREATTHWRWADTLRTRFPEARVRADELYVDTGDVVTGAGATAGIDTCLHLLARFCGQEAASRVARRIVAAPHRAGGQAQFIETPMPVVASAPADALGEAIEWAGARLGERLTIDVVAGRALLSRSAFTRAFRARTGTTFHRWLVERRIARARVLLETTALPVEAVAIECGFATAALLRQRFAAALGTTPTRYRSDFAGAGVGARARAEDATPGARG